MVKEEFINDQYLQAKSKFPKILPPQKIGKDWEIAGHIDIIDDEDSYWDTFEVKILIPENFPEELFKLHETGNRIPKTLEWHNNISCCLSTNAIIYHILGEDISLLNWLVRFGHPFLANYILKTKTMEYANGEFAHYTPGIVEGYQKLFNLHGNAEVVEKLSILCSVLRRGRNKPCFCGSGRKFKTCYLKSPFTHKYLNIPYTILEKDLFEIRTQIKI